MPDSAAGKTTRSDTCSLLAPSPNAPSRSDAGTADIASSATEAIVGSTSSPRMIPADSALNGVDLDAQELAQDLGREERQREVAEDDRRHAGQHLEHRLDDLAHARRRVLGEVDRAQQAERDRDEQARSRSGRACPDQREHAEGLLVAARTAASTSSRRGSRASGTSPKKAIVSAQEREDDQRSS